MLYRINAYMLILKKSQNIFKKPKFRLNFV